MQRCSIWTVSLAAALSLTGAAWADHEGGGGHGPATGHGTTPTFAKQRGSDEAHEARESHSGAQNSGTHSPAGANIAARLTNDPTLSARLTALLASLPAGTKPADLQTAAMGFRNLGQFIAALHVAKDLNISFNQLQIDMTSGHDSLGQAILDQKSGADVKTVIMTARTETKADLKADKAAKEAAEDKDKAEDANEKAAEKAEDAKEAKAAGANFGARLMTRLKNDPTLSAQLTALLASLPAGTKPADLQTAAMGFRNLNQLLTALNVAKDQNLDFGKLQKAIMGGDSLAQAILDQNSSLNVRTVIMTARTETKADLKMVRAAEDKAEDAAEATKEAAEDANEAAEEANEAAKAPAAGTTTTSVTTKP